MQIIPKTLRPGMGEDDEDAYLEVDLRNSTYDEIGNLQFDILLPEGVEYDDYYEFEGTRVPYKSGRGGTTWAFSITVVPQTTNYIRFMFVPQLIDGSLKPITGNEGTFLRIYIRTSESLAEGVYPVKMANMNYYHTEVEGVYLDDAVSYVKVGEQATNTVYDLGDDMYIPSFVQDELDGMANVVVNGACQNLVLVDGHDAVIPCDFTAASASYSRTMGTTWGTICLPYAVTSDESVAYYQITGVENDVLTLTKYDELPAGTPALVKKLAGDGIAPQATSVAVSGDINNVAGSVNMFGSYTNQTRIEDPNSYYIYNDKFYSCNEYFFCNAFRAYFIMEGAGAKVLTIADDDVVTAINALTGENCGVNVEAVYSEDGVLRNDLEAGMNIVKLSNGKTQKVIIK